VNCNSKAGVAQLVEQLIRNQQVGGSNPPASSKMAKLKNPAGFLSLLPFCDGPRGFLSLLPFCDAVQKVVGRRFKVAQKALSRRFRESPYI
jgi:hypothetical protein